MREGLPKKTLSKPLPAVVAVLRCNHANDEHHASNSLTQTRVFRLHAVPLSSPGNQSLPRPEWAGVTVNRVSGGTTLQSARSAARHPNHRLLQDYHREGVGVL